MLTLQAPPPPPPQDIIDIALHIEHILQSLLVQEL
jgi:hypothetical protein